MNNNSKEELKGNEFNRLLLVPCEENYLSESVLPLLNINVNSAKKLH